MVIILRVVKSQTGSAYVKMTKFQNGGYFEKGKRYKCCVWYEGGRCMLKVDNMVLEIGEVL